MSILLAALVIASSSFAADKPADKAAEATRAPANAQIAVTKIGSLEYDSIVRVEDTKYGIVCYATHGSSTDSGTAISCIKVRP